jgi:hypothetical protein
MQRSHSRHTYPLEKGPDRSVREAIRTRVKMHPGAGATLEIAPANTRSMSKAWQAHKRLQAKKRRLSTSDQFGVAFKDAAAGAY